MAGLSSILAGASSGTMPQLDPLTLLQLQALRPVTRPGSGADPNFAYGAMQSLLSPYETQTTPQDPTTAFSALSSVAQSNPDPAAGTALSGALGSVGYSPQTLSGLTSSLYPNPGAASPLYQDPNAVVGGTSATTIGASDVQAIQQDIAQMLSKGADLHTTRLLVMNQARAKATLPPAQLLALFNYIGSYWVSLGGDPGTSPVTAPNPPPGVMPPSTGTTPLPGGGY